MQLPTRKDAPRPVSPLLLTPEGVELLVHEMLDAVLSGTQHITQDEVESWCRRLAAAHHTGLEEHDFSRFDGTLSALLLRMHQLDEDPLFWQNAVAALQQNIGAMLGVSNHPRVLQSAEAVLDRARLEINEESRRHTARKLFWHQDRSDRLSLMTAELLAVSEESEIQTILGNHLEPLMLRQLTLLLFEPDGLDPVGRCRVLLHVSQDPKRLENQFPTRQFPPPDFYCEPYQLVLLPINVNDQVKGCVIFDTPDLEPCGSIVHNLASALRNIALYREAISGRKLAEEANQLKSQFLSMVSHELRTPLNMIVGLS